MTALFIFSNYSLPSVTFSAYFQSLILHEYRSIVAHMRSSMQQSQLSKWPCQSDLTLHVAQLVPYFPVRAIVCLLSFCCISSVFEISVFNLVVSFTLFFRSRSISAVLLDVSKFSTSVASWSPSLESVTCSHSFLVTCTNFFSPNFSLFSQ